MQHLHKLNGENNYSLISRMGGPIVEECVWPLCVILANPRICYGPRLFFCIIRRHSCVLQQFFFAPTVGGLVSIQAPLDTPPHPPIQILLHWYKFVKKKKDIRAAGGTDDKLRGQLEKETTSLQGFLDPLLWSPAKRWCTSQE